MITEKIVPIITISIDPGLNSPLMSRNADSGENGRFDEILSVNLMQITSPEMGLTCWRIWRFYANYITRAVSNVLANLAIFMQITSPEMGLTCC